MSIAILRSELSKLPSVVDSWFEWELEGEGHSKTLVVAVNFDTDTNNSDFDSSALDDIRDKCLDTLKNKTAMVIGRVRVVPAKR